MLPVLPAVASSTDWGGMVVVGQRDGPAGCVAEDQPMNHQPAATIDIDDVIISCIIAEVARQLALPHICISSLGHEVVVLLCKSQARPSAASHAALQHL
jgi:hypothetical protein